MRGFGSAAELYVGVVFAVLAIALTLGATGMLLFWVLFPGIGQVMATDSAGSSLRGEGAFFLVVMVVGLWTMLRLMFSR